MDGQLPLISLENEAVPVPKRGGPPNRMNDLPYREWMKFQKSFFRYEGDESLQRESVQFFTKALLPNGLPSRSLLAGFDVVNRGSIDPPRIVEWLDADGLAPLIAGLERFSADLEYQYDFIFVDLRPCLTGAHSTLDIIESVRDVYGFVRILLKQGHYAGFIVPELCNEGNKFPMAWAIADEARNYFRLRDEKVAIEVSRGELFYCVFVQADSEKRRPIGLKPENIQLSSSTITVPKWIFPKSPPRTRDEILHPAKYPESLVTRFVELFTKPGESIFDPMIGTGSSAVAAIKAGRNGYGVELNEKFASIAERRVQEAISGSATLFSDVSLHGQIVCADARNTRRIGNLTDEFDYIVTSPPYWSMLSNPGSENQRKRRHSGLRLTYSSETDDVGNIEDYDEFVQQLAAIYEEVGGCLKKSGIFTIVVKNVKRNHILYSLGWDLVSCIARKESMFAYLGCTLWFQDDVGLKPFAVGAHWVSNVLHQYCLHFERI